MTTTSKVESAVLVGMTRVPTAVTAEVTRGVVPGLIVEGLPEAQEREVRVRVKAALERTYGEMFLAGKQVTLHYDVPPHASTSHLDLAAALAVVSAIGRAPRRQWPVFGELSLTGEVRQVRGLLSLLYGTGDGALIPASQRRLPFDYVQGVETLAHAADVFLHEEGGLDSLPIPLDSTSELAVYPTPALADIQAISAETRQAFREAVVAGPDILLVGPPGAGKTMLARRVNSLLGEWSGSERLEASRVRDVAGLLDPTAGILSSRPFRAPHHTVSEAGMIGGGLPARPGEVSLASHGVLFLDEVTEFRRSVLVALGETLREGHATTRMKMPDHPHRRATFPACPSRVVYATCPCPCGWRGFSYKGIECVCSPAAVERFEERLKEALSHAHGGYVTVRAIPTSAEDIRQMEA